MKKKLITLSGLVMGFAPVVALAQIQTGIGSSTCGASGPVRDIPSLLCKIGQILTSIVPILVALGIVYFVYGVIMYVIADDEEAKSKGRDSMIYGIIGLAVIVAVWGLVNILVKTFVDTGNAGNITLPTIRL
jgi:hypothetical protein